MSRSIEIGDHVTVGDGSVHWIVLGFPELAETWVYLKSGMTGRMRFEKLKNVRLYAKRSEATVYLAEECRPD